MSKVVDFTGVVQVEKGAPFEFQAKLGGYMYKFAGKVLLSGDQARIEKAMEPTRPVLRRRGGGGYDTENPKYVKANDKWQTDVVLAQFLLAVDSLDMAGDIQHQIDAFKAMGNQQDMQFIIATFMRIQGLRMAEEVNAELVRNFPEASGFEDEDAEGVWSNA